MINYLDTTELTTECAKIWQLCSQENTVPSRVRVLLEYLLHRPYAHLTTALERIKPTADTEALEYMLQQIATAHEAQISFTSFDCVTLVEVVFAVIHSMQYARADKFRALFITNLLSIRYYRGIDTFLLRNHLMETDWLPNNTWLFKDITKSISATTLLASAKVNKFAWLLRHKVLSAFAMPGVNAINHDVNMVLATNESDADNAHNTVNTSNYNNPDNSDKTNNAVLATKITNLLQTHDLDFSVQQATMAYISTTEFLANRQALSAKFPAVAIVNIVRPGWDLTASIGTELNMSHLGITLKDVSGVLHFYHASSIHNMVVCDTMHAYLERYLDSPTVKGINILAYEW